MCDSPTVCRSLLPLLSAKEICAMVEKLGRTIGRTYTPPIHLICVLDASFVFAADLAREILYPTYLHWIKISSYVGTSPEDPKVLWADHIEEGGTRLLVDTIVDTGRTIDTARRYFNNPNLPVVALLRRKGTQAIVDVCGLEISKGFVVGYGLDYNSEYRSLPDIRTLYLPSARTAPLQEEQALPLSSAPPIMERL